MKLITEVKEKDYEQFVINHPTKSHFLQSYAWGELSKAKGLIPHYIGVEDKGKLVAVALLLQKKLPLGYSYFYAPRGYVMNYNDEQLLSFITVELKHYIKVRKGIFLKINPDIKLHQIDVNGQVTKDSSNNYQLVDVLKKLGYRHQGFNKNFEGNQPRYTFRLNLEDSIENIKANMHATTRKIINRNNPYQLSIIKGSLNDIKSFSDLMKVTSNRDNFLSNSYDYYYHFYDILGRYNMANLYLIKVSIKDIIKKTEKMIDDLKQELDSISRKQEGKKQDLLIKLNKLEDNLKEYKMYPKDNDEILISSIITVNYGDKLWTVHGGNHDLFRDLNANYILYYQILLEAKQQGYKVMDFFGTGGNPDKDNKIYGIHLFKKRFGGEYVEFIGDFDLVTKPLMYNIFTKFIPFYRNIKKQLLKRKQKSAN